MPTPTEWFYFGCHREAGHYLFTEGMRQLWRRDWPRELSRFDAMLPPQTDTAPYIAAVSRLEGWGMSALAFWDYSVDKRGGCNSIVFAPSLTIAPDELLAEAQRRFPEVFGRLPQPVRLARGVAPAQAPSEWAEVERIRDLPEVDEALLNFKDDCTGDNAAMVVRAVMRATRGAGVPPAPQPTPYGLAGIEGDAIVIRFTADACAFAFANDPQAREPRPPVVDKQQFLRDTLSELTAEREDGSTPLTDMLDRAMVKAMENGSDALDHDATDGVRAVDLANELRRVAAVTGRPVGRLVRQLDELDAHLKGKDGVPEVQAPSRAVLDALARLEGALLDPDTPYIPGVREFLIELREALGLPPSDGSPR